jgi:hypothetical protein
MSAIAHLSQLRYLSVNSGRVSRRDLQVLVPIGSSLEELDLRQMIVDRTFLVEWAARMPHAIGLHPMHSHGHDVVQLLATCVQLRRVKLSFHGPRLPLGVAACLSSWTQLRSLTVRSCLKEWTADSRTSLYGDFLPHFRFLVNCTLDRIEMRTLKFVSSLFRLQSLRLSHCSFVRGEELLNLTSYLAAAGGPRDTIQHLDLSPIRCWRANRALELALRRQLALPNRRLPTLAYVCIFNSHMKWESLLDPSDREPLVNDRARTLESAARTTGRSIDLEAMDVDETNGQARRAG